MLKSEIRVGGMYVAKISNNLTTVRVDAITDHRGYGSRKDYVTYELTNISTGRKCSCRSAAKFRRVAGAPRQVSQPHLATNAQVHQFLGT